MEFKEQDHLVDTFKSFYNKSGLRKLFWGHSRPKVIYTRNIDLIRGTHNWLCVQKNCLLFLNYFWLPLYFGNFKHWISSQFKIKRYTHCKPKPCIAHRELPVSHFPQEKPFFIAGSLFSLQGFPYKPLYFPVRDCIWSYLTFVLKWYLPVLKAFHGNFNCDLLSAQPSPAQPMVWSKP